MCEYIQSRRRATTRRQSGRAISPFGARSLARCLALTCWLFAPAVWGQDDAPGAPPSVLLPAAILQQVPLPAQLTALDPLEAGARIMAAADAAENGFGNLTVDLDMILRTANGREALRSLTIAQLEVPGDGDRTLVTFDQPKAIRGTGLLSHAHGDRLDDQWLYLPALRRVKKIGARNRSGPFLGSEFSFEDLTSQPLAKFSDRFLGLVPCEAGRCYQIKRVPLDEFSGYSWQTLWVDSDALRVRRIEYFDRQERLKKVLVADGFEQHQGRFWRATNMEMTNVRTGKSTVLRWRNFRYGGDLSAARDFSVNALQRVR